MELIELLINLLGAAANWRFSLSFFAGLLIGFYAFATTGNILFFFVFLFIGGVGGAVWQDAADNPERH